MKFIINSAQDVMMDFNFSPENYAKVFTGQYMSLGVDEDGPDAKD